MRLLSDSITVVLLGDWNKLYIQPEWVANNIYENPELEIGVEGQGADFRVSYRKNGIIINPSQEKIIFTATDTTDSTLKYMAKCISNYLSKAVTPTLMAYGINADYRDAEDTRFASVIDALPDTEAIIDLGYEVSSAQITRTFLKNDKTINMTCSMDRANTTIHFNEHHASPDKETTDISYEALAEFISQTKAIIVGLGYEVDGDENE